LFSTDQHRDRWVVKPWRNLAFGFFLALPLAGCSGVLDPRGPVGVSEKLILLDSLAIMLVIVVPTMFATLAFAWWFRASNVRARYQPHWAFSGTLELIIWAIPALVITFLGGIAWFGSHALDPYAPLPSKEKPLEVEVVSLDWKWLFIYPDDHVAAVNELGSELINFSVCTITILIRIGGRIDEQKAVLAERRAMGTD
jgi:heme/copper-type cytochrome/quinol oxidase subunit 2